MRLVLASGSPRRKELLSFLGMPFEVRPADLDETPHVGELAEPYVGRLSVEKALAVARPGELVLAADTTVALNGEILGKPADHTDAIRMLTMLGGQQHQVHTGLALADGTTGEVLHACVDTAEVVMALANPALIAWYVDTGEPMDKAGSYGVQGIGSVLVERVEGNVQTVIGLPMTIVASWLWPLRHQLHQLRRGASD
jgi:septum formation protein